MAAFAAAATAAAAAVVVVMADPCTKLRVWWLHFSGFMASRLAYRISCSQRTGVGDDDSAQHCASLKRSWRRSWRYALLAALTACACGDVVARARIWASHREGRR